MQQYLYTFVYNTSKYAILNLYKRQNVFDKRCVQAGISRSRGRTYEGYGASLPEAKAYHKMLLPKYWQEL